MYWHWPYILWGFSNKMHCKSWKWNIIISNSLKNFNTEILENILGKSDVENKKITQSNIKPLTNVVKNESSSEILHNNLEINEKIISVNKSNTLENIAEPLSPDFSKPVNKTEKNNNQIIIIKEDKVNNENSAEDLQKSKISNRNVQIYYLLSRIVPRIFFVKKCFCTCCSFNFPFYALLRYRVWKSCHEQTS